MIRQEPLPQSLVAIGREAVLWFNKVSTRSAAASTNATSSTVAPSAGYVQAEATQIVADLNAAITSLNDLKAKLRTAGLLQE